MRRSHKLDATFDDPDLASAAGLVPLLRLAEAAGLYDLMGEHLSVDSPNPVAKSTSVISGMLAGADSIGDLAVLRHAGMRHAGMRRCFAGMRAPSTVGTYLRAFTHGHVAQLDALASRALAGLTGRAPGLLAGTDAMAFVGIDDTIREVHGYANRGGAYGYSGVCGLNAQLAVVSTPVAAPLIDAARLRKGHATSASGAERLLAQAVATVRRARVSGPLMVRADSAYYSCATIRAAIRAKARFLVTARMNPQVVSAITAAPDDAWTAIEYPHALWEEEAGRWVFKAEVAEAPLTAFTSRRKVEQVHCRLVIRRVTRLSPKAGSGQGELVDTCRHHGFVTSSTLSTVDTDAHHRDHAIVEQVISELKTGPLAHLLSGSSAANEAWLAPAVIAFNLVRAAGTLAFARQAKARWATLRTRLGNVPARIASSARRLTVHLPVTWPWAQAWQGLFNAASGPPAILTL